MAGSDGRQAPSRPVANQVSAGRAGSRRWLLVWVAMIAAGSGLVAAALLAFLPQPNQEQAVAAADAPAQPPQRKPDSTTKSASPPPQPSNKAPAAAADESSKALQNPTKVAEGGDAPPPKSDDQPKKPTHDEPEKPLGLMADDDKAPPPDEPKGLLSEAKPEPLALPAEPPRGVVADTPKALYAERTKPKTPEWLAQLGGTVDSQAAVDEGLNWLARHQGNEGHWGADCLGVDPNSRCDHEQPCQGPGQAFEAAQTGLALLAFQAAGNYYFNGQKYSDRVKSGLGYLVSEQAPDGSIVGSQNPSPQAVAAGEPFQQYFMYEHAIATFALCEACAVASAEGKVPDVRYLNAAKRAVLFIERLQHTDGGWRYSKNANEKSDCSVSGWVMLALKTARETKIAVPPPTVARMKSFFAQHQVEGRTYYYSLGQRGTDAMTGVGMMAVEFFPQKLGPQKLESSIVTEGAAYLADSVNGFAAQLFMPSGLPLPGGDYYLWYNCTMAMFQAGGESWKRWNDVVRDRVIGLQVHGESCERGSWPPNDQWSSRGGRVYSTALAVLTLEVYYRFQRVAGQPEKEKFFQK